MAQEAGRDPAELELVVRANVSLSDQPLGDDHFVYTETAEQIAADIAATREIGASEFMFVTTFDPGVKSAEDFLGRMELLSRLAEESLAGSPA